MKWLHATFFLLCTSAAWSAGLPVQPSSPTLKGEVLEVKQVPNYTYLRLKTADGENWAAVSTAKLAVGTQVSIQNAELMDNFKSTVLNRVFPRIYFGSLAPAPGTAAVQVASAHAGISETEMANNATVAKAKGPLARTVAEVINQSSALKDRPVLLHARVVKYNAAVMGKNWIHVRDGSGSATDATNDLLVTTQDQAKLGDIVLVKGLVRKDKDFGSGYAYKVLVEDATLQSSSN